MTESHIQAAILLSWGSHPRIRLVRMNTGGAMLGGRFVRFGFPGCADILGVIAPEGRALAIEVKAAKGRQSEEQKRFERIFTKFGGVYCLARSVEDVDRALAPLGLTRFPIPGIGDAC